jgi:hypothetical protein
MKPLRHADFAHGPPNPLKNVFLSGRSAAVAAVSLLLLQAAPGDFEGRAFAAGPILRYLLPLSSRNLALTAKWLHEFYTHDRFEGDYMYVCIATRI